MRIRPIRVAYVLYTCLYYCRCSHIEYKNQSRRKDSIVRDLQKFCVKFSSIVHMKVKLIEEFEDQVLLTTHFSVGYFVGRQSMKKWLVLQKDLIAISELAQGGKTHAFVV